MINILSIIFYAKKTTYVLYVKMLVSFSQVLAECRQSFHMELYRTSHLYHHGKLFYFTYTFRVLKRVRASEMKEMQGGDKGSGQVKVR